MKKLVLITLLGATVSASWGAAQELPNFIGEPVNMASALYALKKTLLEPSYKTLDILTEASLLRSLNSAIYSRQLNVAGVYATIIHSFGYDHEKRDPRFIKKLVGLLPHYDVPKETSDEIIAMYDNASENSAYSLPAFTLRSTDKASAISALELFLNDSYFDKKPLENHDYSSLSNDISRALYAGQLDLAGIYTIILSSFDYKHLRRAPDHILKLINLLPFYGVPDEIFAKLVAKYGMAIGNIYPVSLSNEIDIKSLAVPHIGEGIVSVTAYRTTDNKIFLSGKANIDGQERPFTARLLADGKTLDITYGLNGLHVPGTIYE